MKISGIVKSVPFLNGNDLATKARQLLRNEKLLFVEKDGNFRGMIDRTTALQITGDKSTLTALDIAKPPLYQTTPDDTVEHVARKMLKYNTYILPVFDGTHPIGYVGLSEILAILILENEHVAKMRIGDMMRTYPIYVDAEDSIVKLWNIMEEIQYSGVPVIRVATSRKDRFNKLAGYVSKKDLLLSGNVRKSIHAGMSRSNQPKVEKIMNRTPILLSEDDTVSTFVEKMIQHDVSRIPVVNEGYELKGIVGKMDVLKLLVEGW
ncbi:CBS domain-containing protein [archaeon]|nr:MAG: CBS domain-containing protein [archaeon]